MLFLLWCFPLFVLIIKHWMPRKGKEKKRFTAATANCQSAQSPF